MKQAKVKLIFAAFLIFVLLTIGVYGVGTTLISPDNNALDTDGQLDLRGSCTPSYDGTTSYNITNASLYSNVFGTWKINQTIKNIDSGPNSTYFFNFTNYINQSPEGEFQWNINCFEENETSAGDRTNSAFAGNNTINVKYADPIVSTTSPVTGTYSLNGHAISAVCTAQASSGWNLTNVSLMTDIRRYTESGAGENWTINQTHTPSDGERGQVVANFTINGVGNSSIPDGTDLLYACVAYQRLNLSDSGTEPFVLSNDASTNKTLNVEYPPLITLNKPADGNWSQTRTTTLSWTVTSAFTASGVTFSTRIWTNETGEWLPRTGTIMVNNNTAVTKTYVFPDQSNIHWNVEAIQSNDGNVLNNSVNRTINIDATLPTLVIYSPSNNSVNNGTITVIYTATDSNLAAVKLYINGGLNWTNVTPTSGESTIWTTNMTVSDRNHNISFEVNDSAGNTFKSGNITITSDTIPPAVTAITNISTTGCDERNITFTTNEIATSNLTYDTDTDTSDGTLVSNSNLITSHGLVLDFNFNGEITHYFNITVKDEANNTNESVIGEIVGIIQTPARICGGWSQYAVYDSLINLSTIQNQSGADLVYFWNATNQDWVFYTAGLTTNEGVKVGFRTAYKVVHLFENTNSTWLRNTTNQGEFHYNVSDTNNFIYVQEDYNFDNLTKSFGNYTPVGETFNFPSFIGNTTGRGATPNNYTIGPFNVTNFAGYNNSAQDYVNHIFNFTWANATLLEPCPNRVNTVTCMESFWVASAFNVTWNTTAIEYNWTVLGVALDP